MHAALAAALCALGRGRGRRLISLLRKRLLPVASKRARVNSHAAAVSATAVAANTATTKTVEAELAPHPLVKMQRWALVEACHLRPRKCEAGANLKERWRPHDAKASAKRLHVIPLLLWKR